MDIIKNPIVIAILAGAITYAYLTWNVEEKKDKKKGKQEKKEINLLIPLVVAVIAWFLAYAYFEYSVDPPQNPQIGGGLTFGDQIIANRRPIPLPRAQPAGHKFVGDVYLILAQQDRLVYYQPVERYQYRESSPMFY